MTNQIGNTYGSVYVKHNTNELIYPTEERYLWKAQFHDKDKLVISANDSKKFGDDYDMRGYWGIMIDVKNKTGSLNYTLSVQWKKDKIFNIGMN